MSAPCYLLAGGGTGGHLFPGLAVADVIHQRDPGARILFLTTDRDLDRNLLGQTAYEQIVQPVRPIPSRPWRLPAFLSRWLRSVRAARRTLRERNVRAVLGLGGYAAGPAVVAAHKLRIPAAILNPDALPGRANRFLARKVEQIFLQWDASRVRFRRHAPCRTVGCPIRAGFGAVDRAAGCARFGLDPHRPTLLVTGASQGARSINRTLHSVWPEFASNHAEWQLLHLTGEHDEAETRAAYDRAGVRATVLPFTHEMPAALAAADLVIARAGASTLAELTACGRPSILLPYPFHRDRHQHANAQVLVDAGAALLVDDAGRPEANHRPVRDALESLFDRPARTALAAAASRIGSVSAAAHVADWLCSVS